MTDLSHTAIGTLVDDASDFFAPAATDVVDALLGQYELERSRIQELHTMLTTGGYLGALNRFIEGNGYSDDRAYRPDLCQLLKTGPAIAALNAAFWGKTLAMTDVYESMPQARRAEWDEQILNPMGKRAPVAYGDGKAGDGWDVRPLPNFEGPSVRATLNDLVLSRTRFLAERIDGVFQALSGEHVTNSPGVFGKRMIVGHMYTSYGSIDSERAGCLHDLRCVIAKFMGREQPARTLTDQLFEVFQRRTGEWFSVDAGAMRMRLFKKGTCHIEVHPEMAWRLNAILANLYPDAIPASIRSKPERKRAQPRVFGCPVPFTVIKILAELRGEPNQPWKPDRWSAPVQPVTDNPHALTFGPGDRDGEDQFEAECVLARIGGVRKSRNALVWFEFEFSPRKALDEIILSGCVPDVQSYQFYPTLEPLAQRVVDLADIQDGHVCLEPEAGIGGLADLMPQDRTLCVELSGLHCRVLKAKGFDVIQDDFLVFAERTAKRFDRIVMNPPFSERRWKSHLEAAATLLNPAGQVTAVLPTSAKAITKLPGFELEWSETITDAFAGTAIAVVILVARKL